MVEIPEMVTKLLGPGTTGIEYSEFRVAGVEAVVAVSCSTAGFIRHFDT